MTFYTCLISGRSLLQGIIATCEVGTPTSEVPPATSEANEFAFSLNWISSGVN